MHPNGMGIFTFFSIIHCFLADCLACHNISLALKQQFMGGQGRGRGGIDRSPARIICLLLTLRNKDLDVKKTVAFFHCDYVF